MLVKRTRRWSFVSHVDLGQEGFLFL
uniref:Uncharacterized protein n=1 Tax=Rhizophora mucronata TaxID=61149 RepID=A0A2P2P7Q8_RHIMU